MRNEPVSLPFEERIKATTLTKSDLEILVVLLNTELFKEVIYEGS